MSTTVANLALASAEMAPRLFDLDLQLIADSVLMIIAVFALFLIASHFLFNPVRDMMEKRQERIKSELDTAASDMENARTRGRTSPPLSWWHLSAIGRGIIAAVIVFINITIIITILIYFTRSTLPHPAVIPT